MHPDVALSNDFVDSSHTAAWWSYLWLAAIFFVSFFMGLDRYTLLNNNEGLYAEIAREMLEQHTYVVPTLNYVPYIEKPPLLYWLIALSYSVFGISEWAARLVPASFGLAACIGVLHVGNKIGRPRAGFLGALALASSTGFILLARTVMFDVALTTLMSFALWSFYFWYSEGKKRYLRAMYILSALAVLTKGFVAILLVALVALACLVLMRPAVRRYVELIDLPGIAIFLALLIPWHLAMALSDPGFPWFYFINEHASRFFGTRLPRDYQSGSALYYLPRIAIEFMPWTPLLLASLLTPREQPHERQALVKFLWTWILVFALFFSLAGNKGNYYLITILPATAMLLGLDIDDTTTALGKRLVQSVATTTLFVSAVLLPLIAFYLVPSDYTLVALTATSIICLALIFAPALPRRPTDTIRFDVTAMALAGLSAPFLIIALYAASSRQDALSEATLATVITRQQNGHPVVLYRDFERLSSIVFYLKRPIPIVGTQSQDLYYGWTHGHSPQQFISIEDFARRQQHEKYLVIVKSDLEQDFRRETRRMNFCTAAQVASVKLFSNDPATCIDQPEHDSLTR